MATDATLSWLKTRFPGLEVSEFRGQVRVVMTSSQLRDSLQIVRDSGGFDLLVDVTCVDYLNDRDARHRFGLVYLLCNSTSGARLTVRVFLDDRSPVVDSVVSLWEGANWMEREVWDMFGIRFEGHPDLRRILMPEEFSAHPLRKDYPLQGRGERHNFPVIRRGQA